MAPIRNKNLDIVALVPARSGSKGIRDKNILPLGGHPLIGYSIVASKQAKLIKEVYVTTDSEEYGYIASSYGAVVPFLRPAEISNDLSTDKEFFLHFIEWCKNTRKKIPDLIVHLRPSTPLRDFRMIDKAIQKFINNPEASALRSCQHTELTPYKMFFNVSGYMKPCISDNSYLESYNQPRQVFPKTYLPNGYVDIVRPSVLLSTGLLHGNKILLNLTQRTADIDNIDDYEIAKQLLNNEKYLDLKKALDRQL
jgi:CMP-N,N'-diacetyllegionaminic acid synthase